MSNIVTRVLESLFYAICIIFFFAASEKVLSRGQSPLVQTHPHLPAPRIDLFIELEDNNII